MASTWQPVTFAPLTFSLSTFRGPTNNFETLVEAIAFSDVIIAASDASETLVEAIAFNDNLIDTGDAEVVVVESMRFSSTVIASQSVRETIVDSIGLASTSTASKEVTETLTSTIAFSDTISLVSDKVETLAETIVFASNVIAERIVTETLSDGIAFSDVVAAFVFGDQNGLLIGELLTFPKLEGRLVMSLVPDSDNLIAVRDVLDAETCLPVTDALGTYEVIDCNGTIISTGQMVLSGMDYVGRMSSTDSAALQVLELYTIKVLLSSTGRDRTWIGQTIAMNDIKVSQCP